MNNLNHFIYISQVLFNGPIEGDIVGNALYEKFSVGPATEGYPIKSLGKYHGTAGDGLCPHLGTEFMFNTAASEASWWGVSVASASFTTTYNGVS